MSKRDDSTTIAASRDVVVAFGSTRNDTRASPIPLSVGTRIQLAAVANVHAQSRVVLTWTVPSPPGWENDEVDTVAATAHLVDEGPTTEVSVERPLHESAVSAHKISNERAYTTCSRVTEVCRCTPLASSSLRTSFSWAGLDFFGQPLCSIPGLEGQASAWSTPLCCWDQASGWSSTRAIYSLALDGCMEA